MGCTYSKNQAGLFVWAKIPEKYKDSYQLSDEILDKRSVFITPGGIFGDAGKKFVRVSLCVPKEKIEEAVSRMTAE